MVLFFRLDSVSFNYDIVDDNFANVDTGIYFVPQLPNGDVHGRITISFTPINYILPYTMYINRVAAYLYCDDTQIDVGDIGFIWEASKVNNDIPPDDGQHPVTVTIPLHSFRNLEDLVSASDHTIKLRFFIEPTSDYSGSSPTPEFTDNAIEIKSLNKIVTYIQDNGLLKQHAGLMRVRENGEWKFARTQNLP